MKKLLAVLLAAVMVCGSFAVGASAWLKLDPDGLTGAQLDELWAITRKVNSEYMLSVAYSESYYAIALATIWCIPPSAWKPEKNPNGDGLSAFWELFEEHLYNGENPCPEYLLNADK